MTSDLGFGFFCPRSYEGNVYNMGGFIIKAVEMTTITIQVPNDVVGKIKEREWDTWLKKLREYRKDQEDITLVQEEMKKAQAPVCLSEYLSGCDK